MSDDRQAHSETARQWVHIGSGLFALLLRMLTSRQAAALAAMALAFNILLLPRLGGRQLYRPIDRQRGYPVGILLYPLSILLLTLAFPSRLDIVAAAWAILAFGDGAATLVGRQFSEKTATRAKNAGKTSVSPNSATLAVSSGCLPWNRDKTVAGTLAFVVCGGAAGVALAWWVQPAVTPTPPPAFTIAAPLAAALLAALVETIPVRLDDNISVPLFATIVLWLGSMMTWASLSGSRAAIVAALPWALGINAITAWLGYRARAVSRSGASVGAIVGSVIYAGGGAGAWVL
ncbi:MAG: hypothetical protein ACRD2I_12480, partial [Vicinamibacterales bacterium]